VIVCGWCGYPTKPAVCGACGRDPVKPWTQRGTKAPEVDPNDAIRKRLTDAAAFIEAHGQRPTAERIAEHLDVSPRTVRRWQQMAGS
jgi:hypothetical protein